MPEVPILSPVGTISWGPFSCSAEGRRNIVITGKTKEAYTQEDVIQQLRGATVTAELKVCAAF